MRKPLPIVLLPLLLFISMTAVSQVGPPPPPPELTVCTIAISPATDSSCTSVVLPLTTSETEYGSDLIYNGTSGQYVQVPAIPALLTYDTALTISAWVRLTNAANDQEIVSFLSAAMNDGFDMRVQNGALYADVYDSTGTDHAFSGVGSVSSGVWTQIAITYQYNDSMIAYINGVEVAAQALGGLNIARNNYFMTFGIASWDQASDPAAGQIDEVRMYTTALSPAQMAATYDVIQSPYVYGMLGYWRFDEGSGSVTLDATDNAIDGYLTNSPVWNTPSTVPLTFPITYNWTPVLGLSSSGSADPVATVSATTKYYVTLIDSATHCSAKDSITIHILSSPTRATASAATVCTGDTVTLSAAGFQSLVWSAGGASTDSVAVAPVGTTSYIVSGTDSAGCAHSDTVHVGVYPNVAVQVSASQALVCHGDSSVLSVTGLSSAVWNPGAITGDTLVVTPSALTTYTVIGLDSNSCPHADSVSIGLYPAPAVTATADPGGVCPGDTAVLTATGLSTYAWRPSGAVVSVVSVAPVVTTTYSVAGIDSNGCSGTDTVTLQVYNLPAVPVITRSGYTLTSSSASGYQWYRNDTLIAGAISQTYVVTVAGSYTVEVSNASGCTAISLQSSIVLGISDILASPKVDIYPNPVSDQLHVSVSGTTGYQISIIDATGRTLISSATSESGNTIDLSALSSGSYFVKITGNGFSLTKQLIKE